MSASSRKTAAPKPPASHIVTCGHKAEVGVPVLLWNHPRGYRCPNPRGRNGCTAHDPKLNDAPTRAFSRYRITDPDAAYRDLQRTVHQLIIHYDECFTSAQCHQLLQESGNLGSHFYLDLDGTLYQTCDLYWRTNTAPADDRKGNDRAVHVEMANLSWQAFPAESDLHRLKQPAYRNKNGKWKLELPAHWHNTLYHSKASLHPARTCGSRGYFSRWINGRRVRMWDFTEAQYNTLIRLCFALNELLPRIQLRVPFDEQTRRTPLGVLTGFQRFKGILGHAHVQSGKQDVLCKYDPGSAFNWGRLRRAFAGSVDPRRTGGPGRRTSRTKSG